MDKQSVRFLCDQCRLRSTCLPNGIGYEVNDLLYQALLKQQILQKGEILFKENDPFIGFYIVRSGSFKGFKISERNPKQEVVLSFSLIGDSLGLDGFCSGQHSVTVKALEDSSVCLVSLTEIMKLMQRSYSLMEYMVRAMSQRKYDAISEIVFHHTAEERMLAFLRKIARHFESRGFSGHEFNLPMSRKDIASYLDLAIETVSRLFKDLQKKGLIEVDHKDVKLIKV